MTWATIWRAGRRAWRFLRGISAWMWLAVCAAIAALQYFSVRQQLAAERRSRIIERDQATAARIAAERAALAKGKRIDARDVATRVHDAARERIDADSSDISKAAASGNQAIADQGNAIFGGK